MQLSFVQLAVFVSDWRRLALTDEDLQALEELLLQRGKSGPVIPGTGGFRKIRFAPPSWRSGKSGAARVIYAYFFEIEWVVLFLIYGKNEQGNLTPKQKQAAREWIASFKRRLADRRKNQ